MPEQNWEDGSSSYSCGCLPQRKSMAHDDTDARPFKQLLRMVVRAFYPTQCPPVHHQDAGDEGPRSKLSKIDTTGLGIVIMDYMLDREWIGEEQMCTDLGQHHKILRRALKFLEHEHLLMSHSQRETKRSQKRDIVKAAVDAHSQMQQQLQDVKQSQGDDDDEEAVVKQHTYSYWAVDFPRAFDMIQLRLHIMKRLLKDELDAKEVLAKYMCKAPWCNKEYDSYDITSIMQPDGTMQCMMCQTVVEQVLATGQTGDDEQRKARRERLSKLLRDMDRQLDPINKLVQALRNVQPPHHGSIAEWARMQQARLASGNGFGAGNGSAAAGETRSRTTGGITQLQAPTGKAAKPTYQETHVQVTIAEPLSTGNSTAAVTEVRTEPTILGTTAGKAAPSLQPYFLKRPSSAQQIQNNQPTQQGYNQSGLLSGQVGHGDTPPAKRMKVEDIVEKEEPQSNVTSEAQAADEEEWEDI